MLPDLFCLIVFICRNLLDLTVCFLLFFFFCQKIENLKESTCVSKYYTFSFLLSLEVSSFLTDSVRVFSLLQSMVESIKHCIVLLQIAKVGSLITCLNPSLCGLLGHCSLSWLLWKHAGVFAVCPVCKVVPHSQLLSWSMDDGGCGPVLVSSHVPFSCL